MGGERQRSEIKKQLQALRRKHEKKQATNWPTRVYPEENDKKETKIRNRREMKQNEQPWRKGTGKRADKLTNRKLAREQVKRVAKERPKRQPKGKRYENQEGSRRETTEKNQTIGKCQKDTVRQDTKEGSS